MRGRKCEICRKYFRPTKRRRYQCKDCYQIVRCRINSLWYGKTMTQRTRYFVRYYRETIGKRQFDSAADAVAFAVEMKKIDRLVDVGQQSTETVDIKIIEGHAVKELKGNK